MYASPRPSLGKMRQIFRYFQVFRPRTVTFQISSLNLFPYQQLYITFYEYNVKKLLYSTNLNICTIAYTRGGFSGQQESVRLRRALFYYHFYYRFFAQIQSVRSPNTYYMSFNQLFVLFINSCATIQHINNEIWMCFLAGDFTCNNYNL